MASHARELALLLSLLAAICVGCTSAGVGGDAGAIGDAGDAPDSGQAACTAVAEGRWQANGTCFGMLMAMDVSADGCDITFGNWNMVMSVPAGATVSGTDVALTGAQWDDCTGTVTADGESINGTCSDGCAFTMGLTSGS